MKIIWFGLLLLLVCSGGAHAQDDSLAGSFLSGKRSSYTRSLLCFVTMTDILRVRRSAGHADQHGRLEGVPRRLCAHAGHADLLRGARGHSVSVVQHALLRGAQSR